MSENREPAWLLRLDRDAELGVTHSMSGFAAGCLATEYRKKVGEIERLRKTIAVNKEEVRNLVQERDQYKASLEVKYNVRTDIPLFKGLVGGSFSNGALLATCHRLQGELDEARRVAREQFSRPIPFGKMHQLMDEYPWLEDTE